MQRTLRKGIRDLVIANTIGQALVVALEFLPQIGEVYAISPATVATVSTTLTLALALWRVLRDYVDAIAEVDKV